MGYNKYIDSGELARFEIECDCGCGRLAISKWNEDPPEDEELFLSYSYPAFYSMQRGAWDIIKDRLQMIWFILRGKEFYLYELIIPRKQWDDFKAFINSVK